MNNAFNVAIIQALVCQRCGRDLKTGHLCPDRAVAAHRRLMDERGGDLQGYLKKHPRAAVLRTIELFREDLRRLARLVNGAKDFMPPERQELVNRIVAANWK